MYPSDVIFIPCVEVTSFVIIDKVICVVTLSIVFCNGVSFFEPEDDLVDGFTIETARLINVFVNLAVFFYELRIQTIRYWSSVIWHSHIVVELLYFFF